MSERIGNNQNNQNNQNNRHNMIDKLEGVEKGLVDHYQARQKEPLTISDRWLEQVMDYLAMEPAPTSGHRFDISGLQERLIWRFSSVAAATSMVMLILYFTLGSHYNLEILVGMLLNPLGSLDVGWIWV